jgi:hypothetical protein
MKLDPSTLRAEPVADTDAYAKDARNLSERAKWTARIKGMLVDPQFFEREGILRSYLEQLEQRGWLTPPQQGVVERLEQNPPSRRRKGW